MSLGRLFKATKSISFKLTAWYSGVFILSAILLFHLSFFFLSNTLERQDRSRIAVELEELAAKYETGGMPSLENELLARQTFRKKRPFIVRVADGSNASVSIFSPAAWAEFDLTHMEELPPRQKVRWAKLPSREGSHFLVMGLYRLSDGLWLQVGLSTEEREALLERFRGNLLIPSLSIVLVGLLVGPLLAFRALRPIRKLIGTMRSMNVASMSERLPVAGAGDELSELVSLFNEMLAKIETLISAMRAALDNVAHDLRTPLTRLRGTAELALHADAGPEPCREALADCLEESERVLQMLNALMDISEAEGGTLRLELKAVRVAGLVDEIMELYSDVAEEKGVLLRSSIPGDLWIRADLPRMRQVLGNLLDNGVKYTPRGGRVDLTARREGGFVWISVLDNGVGIPEDDLGRIWDRLYRGDRSRSEKGLGLGLSLVRAIVIAHGGTARADSQPGKGSRFVVSLPEELPPSP